MRPVVESKENLKKAFVKPWKLWQFTIGTFKVIKPFSSIFTELMKLLLASPNLFQICNVLQTSTIHSQPLST